MKTYLFFIIVFVCHFNVHSQNELTPEDKLFGLSTIWQEANYNFAFFDQIPSLDWNSEYKKTIPLVLNTTTDKEYYKVLKQFAAKLQDGHTQVYFPDKIEATQTNLKIRVAIEQGEYTIIDVAQKLKKKLPIGSKIIMVNDLPIKEYVAKFIRPYLSSSTEQGYNKLVVDYLFYGDFNDTLTLTVHNSKGEHTANVIRDYTKYGDYILGFRDTLPQFEQSLKDNFMIVALNSFENDEVIGEFNNVIAQINQQEGLIIDLRNNVGGKASVALEIAKHLVQSNQLVTLPWKSKHHIASHKAWGNSGLQLVGYNNVNDYKEFGENNNWIEITADTLAIAKSVQKVQVPIKILIGPNTASAAENFLVYLENQENIEIIGTPTFGSTGQPIYFPLPGNGYARICVKRNYTHSGEDIVGVGILPDTHIPIVTDDLLLGEDLQLEYAIRH